MENINERIEKETAARRESPRYAFGQYLRDWRMERMVGLREFCKTLDVDSANWSKLERGILAPTENPHTLHKIALGLGLKDKSDEYYRFHSLATAARRAILYEMTQPHEASVGVLPFFPSKSDGTRLTKDELTRLVDFLNEEERPTDKGEIFINRRSQWTK